MYTLHSLGCFDYTSVDNRFMLSELSSELEMLTADFLK